MESVRLLVPAPLCLPLAGFKTWSEFANSRFPHLLSGGQAASLMSCCENSMREHMLNPERGCIWCSLHAGCCHPHGLHHYSTSTCGRSGGQGVGYRSEAVGSPALEALVVCRTLPPYPDYCKARHWKEAAWPTRLAETGCWATLGLNPNSALTICATVSKSPYLSEPISFLTWR